MSRLVIGALALLLAACAGGVEKEFTSALASQCGRQTAIYDGHRLACFDVPQARACTAQSRATAEAVNREARALCAGPDTPAARAALAGLIERQMKAGRE